MLELQFLRDNPAVVKQAMEAKGIDGDHLVEKVLELDSRRRMLQSDLNETQARINNVSRDIGALMKAGEKEEAQRLIAESGQLKTTVKGLEETLKTTEGEQRRLLLEIPNIPHPSVPVGKTPAENQVVYEWGSKQVFDFDPLPHWELAERHGLIDFERGAKVTGAGFPFYLGPGARLQRALIHFFLDLAVQVGGYSEMQPPLLVNAASAEGTGQLPDKEGQMYGTRDERFEFYLVPTAEVPVTNYFRDEILDEADLPVKFCAYTPCFRREAGSYGKEVRGLNRLHQFDKVELVQFVHPDTSYDALEDLREHAERTIRELELPYRRMLMCTGDMGFTQSKKYDLEVWSAAQGRWLEVSSISNFEAFQARRANIRFRPAETGTKPQFLHTLNGSGLALPRILAALLENNQQADGSIVVPKALIPYTGFDRIADHAESHSGGS